MKRCSLGLVVLLGIVVLLAAGCGSEAPQQTEQPTIATEDPALVESEPSSPAPWSSAELKSASLTRKFTNQSQYTCTIKLTVWEPIPKDVDSPVTHPESDAAVIDPASDYDPAMDAVIPFAMKLTNTTKGFDLEEPGMHYRLSSSTGGQTYDGATETRTLEAWALYSDGMDVTTWDLYGGGVSLANGLEDTWPSVSWSEPLASGDSVALYGYFVYRDHSTPAEPHGSKKALDLVVVMPTYTGGTATGPTHTKGLSLTGKVEETGLVW